MRILEFHMRITHRWRSIGFRKVKIILTFYRSACGMPTKNGNANPQRGMWNPHRIVRNGPVRCAIHSAEMRSSSFSIPQKYEPALRVFKMKFSSESFEKIQMHPSEMEP